MRTGIRIAAMALVLSWAGAVFAEEPQPVRDEQAVTVLKAMSGFLAGLDRFSISGEGSTDSRLDAGLIVANPIEVKLKVQRPGSLHISRFDGAETQHLFVDGDSMTLYDTSRGFYASTEVPEGIEAAMGYALEELAIEAPLMDLLHHDVFSYLAGTSDSVLYLSDKSRVDGVDCHHIAIRDAEVDIQICVEEGQRPLPRQLILTSKWEGGAPRFVARLYWNLEPDFSEDTFNFVPPEGVSQIDFLQAPAE